MSVGDLKKMGQLAQRLDDLSQVPSRAARDACDGINEAIQEGYSNGTDPYGNPWASLAERTLEKHGEPALQAEFGGGNGPMADGTIAKPAAGAGIQLTVPFPGGIHQTGASSGNWKMPARRILPQGAQLPGAYKSAIDTALRNAFGGKR